MKGPAQPIVAGQGARPGAVRVGKPDGGGGDFAIALKGMAGDASNQLHAQRRHRRHPIFEQRRLREQDGRDRAAEREAFAVVSQGTQPAG